MVFFFGGGGGVRDEHRPKELVALKGSPPLPILAEVLPTEMRLSIQIRSVLVIETFSDRSIDMERKGNDIAKTLYSPGHLAPPPWVSLLYNQMTGLFPLCIFSFI